MKFLVLCWALLSIAVAQNFTIIGGQIFTPGLAIVDAPQPNTPLGGDTLQVALDVSGDGKLQLPPYPSDSPTEIYNITIFLSSYETGLNLTITNGTATVGNGSLGDIMQQESGSTVKHVNWVWPACLVGNGQPTGSDSSRGTYNISIRQNFRLNNTNFYTIFDLPISVTNEISASSNRVTCDSLNNDLISADVLNSTATTIPPDQFPWTNGNGAQVSVSGSSSGSGTSSSSGSGTSSNSDSGTTSTSTGLGTTKPTADAGDGLGSGAPMVEVRSSFGIAMIGVMTLALMY